MKNFSRQREEIIKVLRSIDTHPTAAWVYSRVKEVIPNISLGTVYRNLAALSETGENILEKKNFRTFLQHLTFTIYSSNKERK